MKSVKRLVLMLALVMVVAVPVLGAHAQAAACTLTADQCKLIEAANANMTLEKYSSFEHALDFGLKANANGQNIEVAAKGSGVFSIDASKVSPTDPTAAIPSLKLTVDFEGSVKGTGDDQSAKLQLVIVDGVAYATDGKAGWKGVKLSDVMASAMGSMNGAGGAGGMGAMQGQAMQMMSDPQFAKALAAIPGIAGFITVTAAEGPEVDGQKTLAVTYAIDPKVLFTSKDALPLLKTILKATNPTGPEMTDAQIAQYGQIATILLKDFKLEVTRWIGETDQLYHGIGLTLNVSVDPAMMGGSGSATTIDLNFMFTMTKVGEPVTVTAPEGAEIMTPPPPAK